MAGIYTEDLIREENEIRYQIQSFGDSVLLIMNPNIFLSRIHKELDRLGFQNHRSDKITYYENNYSGDITPFMKNEKFKHQSEFRIFVPNEKQEPIRLNIGSLHDIASLNTGVVKLTYLDQKEQLIYL